MQHACLHIAMHQLSLFCIWEEVLILELHALQAPRAFFHDTAKGRSQGDSCPLVALAFHTVSGYT